MFEICDHQQRLEYWRRFWADVGEDVDEIRSTEVYPRLLDDAALAGLSSYMSGAEVLIHVGLGTGDAEATVWGCDLSDTYVRFNADYTT